MSVLQTILAVALVHSNPPHYHLRAQRLLDTLLQKKPDDWQCLLGKAYICLHADKYEDAYNLFDRVHETLPSSAKNHDRVKFECRCERAWALGNIRGRRKDALDELHEVASVMDKDETIERVDKAKSWWRYGQVLWLIDGKQSPYPAYMSLESAALMGPHYQNQSILTKHNNPSSSPSSATTPTPLLSPLSGSTTLGKAKTVKPLRYSSSRKPSSSMKEKLKLLGSSWPTSTLKRKTGILSKE